MLGGDRVNDATRERYGLGVIVNDQRCRDGDLLLLDVAAEYAGWNSDLTRTIPVNGKFTPRQRAVYDAVLRVFRATNTLLRPGNTPAKLQKHVDSDLGGFDKFRADFINAGVTQFGSGWCWLAMKDGKFAVMKTANGENPLMHGAVPLLGCDVWEHSYYIDYRNARPKYLEAFVDSLVNWEYVEKMYAEATK